MHTNTLEEMELTKQGSGQEQQPEPPETTASPEPEAVRPETQEQETTALVPTEPEVIEGEVIELAPPIESADRPPHRKRPYWLLVPFTILLCLVFVAVSSLLPLLSPSATVTVIPVEQRITTQAVIQVQGRELPALTLMQSMSAPATGKRHQDAARATGTITFYNGLLSRQTIPDGTVLTGSDGTQVVTDQAAVIPAANPPLEGQITVPAHALLAGVSGNIQAFDINQACCATSVVAKNTESFTGGASVRDFHIVTRSDINTAVTSLLITLSRSENAVLQAQLHPGEALAVSSCTPHVASNHKPGDEAKQVTITVSDTCGGLAYAAREVDTDATQLLTAQAITTLGAEYALLGDIQIAIVHTTTTDHRQGSVSMDVQVTGTWVYQISRDTQQRLIRLIAGKTNQQAEALLVQFPGIAGAQITLRGGNRTLPQDPRRIHIIVIYRSASE